MTELSPVKGEDNKVACDIKSTEEPKEKNRFTIWVIIAVITTFLGSGFPAGFAMGVINTPHETIRKWINSTMEENTGYVLTPEAEIYTWAVTVSIYVVGATIGSPLGALLADKGGRRLGLFINHLNFLLAGCLCAWCKDANSIAMLIMGRFLSGFSSGLTTSLMPVYLSEVAPPALRGVMGVIVPSAMSLGVLASQVLGMEVLFGTDNHWPYLVGGFGIPALIALIMHPALPDSPAYCFIILEDEEKGRKALYRLRGGPSPSAAVEEMTLMSQMRKKYDTEDRWNLFSMVKSEKYRLPLIIAMVFNIGQQFSGINAVFYYSTLIFRSAGLSMSESQGASIGACAVNWIVSVIAIPLIRYTRRRVLMLCSAVLCVFCLAILMTSLAFIQVLPYISYIAMATLMLFVLCYHLGVGPIPFMISTELFPSGPRSVGVSVASTCNWLSNLVVGLTFPLIQAQIGEYSFGCFMISTILLCIFTYKFLPETLGLEEGEHRQRSSSTTQEDSDMPSKV